MEETFLKLAASLGGFAGLAFFGVVYFIGKRMLELEKSIRELSATDDRRTRMELLRLFVSPHVATEVKDKVKQQLEDVEMALKIKGA